MRFYYRRNPEDEDQKIGQLAVYHFNVDILGSQVSSFYLAAVLQHHSQKHKLEHTALDIGRNIPVDNLVTGTGTEEEEAKTYFERTKKIFQEAKGFQTTYTERIEWNSNELPENHIRTSLDYSGPPKIDYHWSHSSNTRKQFGQNGKFSSSSRHYWTLSDGHPQQHSKPNFL